MLAELLSDIRLAAEAYGYASPPRPVLGTLRTGMVQALTASFPGLTTDVIAWERELFTLVLLLSKVVAQAMVAGEAADGWIPYSLDRDEVATKLKENDAPVRHMWELVAAFLATGRPTAAPPYLVEQKTLVILEALIQTADLFLMGHEYAHAMARHATLQDATFDGYLVKGPSDWEKEFDADLVAIQLATYAGNLRGLDFALSCTGSVVMLGGINVLQVAKATLNGGIPQIPTAGSHPPALARLGNIRRGMMQAEDGEKAVGLAEAISYVYEHLWSSIGTRLVDAHARGLRSEAAI